jgi:hypothetical protein
MRARTASEAIDGVVGTIGVNGTAGCRPRVAADAVGVRRTGKLGLEGGLADIRDRSR